MSAWYRTAVAVLSCVFTLGVGRAPAADLNVGDRAPNPERPGVSANPSRGGRQAADAAAL